MKTVNLATDSSLSDLLDLAGEDTVLLKTPEGREFILAAVDDFDAEIKAVRQNQELLELLEQRSGEEKTYTISQVRERLKLT
ncbi:MAG: hypothetical protein JF614_16045 [Acidobacteria bacterium]|nr:hypothetical protein [Acidobacteriota bacterium]